MFSLLGRLGGCAPIALCVCTIFLVCPAGGLQARQFRSFNQIVTPERLPPGAVRIERFKPVDRDLVVRAVNALAKAWNTGALDPMLDPTRFYDRHRLLDTLIEVAPREAVLNVQSVGAIQTLEQYHQARDGYMRQVSIVAAIVRTEIEFHDINNGLIRLEGRNEFVLEIEEPATKSPS